MLKRHSQLMLTLLGAADLLAAVAAWPLAYVIRVLGNSWHWSHHAPPPFPSFLPAMGLCLVLTVLVFSRFDLYKIKRTRSLASETIDIAKAVLLAWSLTYVLTNFMQRIPISRLMMGGVLASWLAVALTLRVTARAVLRHLRRKGLNLRHAAIVGTGRLAQRLYHTLERNTWTGIETAFFISDGGRRAPLFGREVVGPLSNIVEILTARPVDLVFVALSGQQRDKLESVLSDLVTLPADVRVLPDLLSFHFLGSDVSQLEDLPIIGLTSSPQEGWNGPLKRAVDIVLSLAGIVLCALPMAVLAAAIKLTSKGPVLYRQRRASLGDQPFMMLKFRTMRQDAEAGTGPVWAGPDDPRVTRLGRWLRRTSLDELPQLFNILKGDMSLVGPRPERPELIERFRRQVPGYMLRSHVKAGLTGWAQVHGLRGRTSLRKRVQYDLHYIANWSFGLDLRILVMTLFRGFINPNAY
ncbi:MAG: undecaprenyl-phosphate glucose phosphotransferase [Planctomycetes bacterium]|nr:undecaprenyl-phosphate glucose phosphotransferase [Planctomycetota bacterium]